MDDKELEVCARQVELQRHSGLERATSIRGFYRSMSAKGGKKARHLFVSWLLS